MKKIFYSLAFIAISFGGNAQRLDSLFKDFTLNFNVEAYYSYDFNEPESLNRPAFVYSHNRHNEFNINTVILKTAYNNGKVRGNFGLISGTYAQANYAAESPVFQKVFEANAGFQFAKNFWLDAGIMPSHIGFETAIGQDNWNLTRCIMADNTPYFMTGTKIAYEGAKWYAALVLLNGWQNIHDNNPNKAVGWQITWKPCDKILFNSSTFFGEGQNAIPSTAIEIRYFHDFYASFQLSDKFSLATLFDIGWQENLDDPTNTKIDNWYSAALLLKYVFSDKFILAGRGELYFDKNGVVIPTGTQNGMNTKAFSINLDFTPAPKILWRFEGKYYTSEDDIFSKGNGTVVKNTSFVLSTALGFKF